MRTDLRSWRARGFCDPVSESGGARNILHSILYLCGALSTSGFAADRPAAPNIIVIFADDQGYADFGAHGIRDDISTPHIDGLADRGVRMIQGFVSAPQCMPSRVGLLTGRYQQHGGVESNTRWIEGNAVAGMRPDVQTLASLLRGRGYTTGMAGKWGVGGGPKWVDILSDRVPSVREEERALLPPARGFDECFSGVQTLFFATHDAGGAPLPDAPVIVRDEGYRTEVQGAAAVSFIERHAKDPNPFFLYYAPYSPHAPFTAPEKYMNRFRRVADERRRVCLAMMACLDATVGEIVHTLNRFEILEDTMIWFISDNGAPRNGGGSNAPFNGWKGSLLDGGIRVPFVLSWPSRMPSGLEYSAMVSSLDVLPTCLSAAAVRPIPEELDGVDLLPFLTGQKSGRPHDHLYFRWLQSAAVRTHEWKLIRRSGETELFSLTEDPEETVDRSAERPGVYRDLDQRLSSWLQSLPAVQANERPRRVR